MSPLTRFSFLGRLEREKSRLGFKNLSCDFFVSHGKATDRQITLILRHVEIDTIKVFAWR